MNKSVIVSDFNAWAGNSIFNFKMQRFGKSMAMNINTSMSTGPQLL